MMNQGRHRATSRGSRARRLLATGAAALAALATLHVLQPDPAHAGPASYTSTNPDVDGASNQLCLNHDNTTVDCNIYTDKNYVWLNGGPATAYQGDGTYFFAVLAPGGQNDLFGPKLLSEDGVEHRTYTVSDGQISITAPSDHDLANNKLRLMPYLDTPNNGGEYTMAICFVPDGTAPADVAPKTCKYDNFKIRSGTVTPPPYADKTATLSHERTVHWTITKTVDGVHSEEFDQSDPQTVHYVVTATKQASDTYSVAGTVTVTNPAATPVHVAVTEDGLDGGLASDCTFTSTGTGTVEADVADSAAFDYTCAISSTPDADLLYENQATVTYSGSGGSGSFDVYSTPAAFPAATYTDGSDPESITVSDTNPAEGLPATISDTQSFPYTAQLFNHGCQEYDNTASLSNGQQDSTAVIFCGPLVPLTGSKSAQPSHEIKVHWDISKTVNGVHRLSLSSGTAVTTNYAVTATRTVLDEKFGLAGSVHVDNPNPDAVSATVTEDGLSPELASDCAFTDPTQSVPGYGSKEFTYTCTVTGAPNMSTPYQNNATIHFTDPVEGAKTVPVSSNAFTFPAASPESGSDPLTITVSDPNAPASAGFPKTGVSDTTTWTYQVSYFNPGCVDYPNTATLSTGLSDSTLVTFCGPITGGLTQGWWQNKNGQALLASNLGAACATVNGYLQPGGPGTAISGLANANGKTTYDPTKCAGPNTKDPSYLPVFDLTVFAQANSTDTGVKMLESQWLTTTLDTVPGYVNKGAGTPGLTSGLAVVVPTALQGYLGADHITIGGLLSFVANNYASYSGNKAEVTALQAFLNAINNNQALQYA